MKKNYLILSGLALIVLSLHLNSFVWAHGLGQALEKEVSGYIIDVGYDAVDSIETDIITIFDFNLLTRDRLSTGDFTSVWVRIAPSNRGLSFAGFLYRPEFLLTRMSYTFYKPGQYDLTARFLDKENQTLAEATFPLEIRGGNLEQKALVQSISVGIGGLVLGVVGAWFFRRKNE